MNKIFDIIFLEEAFTFLAKPDRKHYEKILFNIRKAQTEHNPELFKKRTENIWEFRTRYQGYNIAYLPFRTKQTQQILW